MSTVNEIIDPSLIEPISTAPKIIQYTAIEEKTDKVALEALNKNQGTSNRKKRRKIKKIIFNTGKIVIGIMGACIGGPVLGPLSIGVGVSGVLELGYAFSDIVTSGDAHDRIDDINRGHRESDETLKK